MEHFHDRKIATQAELDGLLRFIRVQWTELVRSNSDILAIVQDPKWPIKEGERWPLYVSAKEDPAAIERKLRAMNRKEDMDQIEVLTVPKEGPQTKRQGMLYLPHDYVVPGGRFVEMYAWDSFFIFLGLNMVDNFIYSVKHYGTVCNGNRTYYLSRSQLPFLGRMILLMHETGRVGDVWLRDALRAAEQYHRYYTSGGHHIESIGLERFFDFGPHGSPPPEADAHEKDGEGRETHERIREYFRTALEQGGIPDYDISLYYDVKTDTLTPKYYDNDRAMRESGFDYSRRFGAVNAAVLDFAPVCLNSLLCQLEMDIAAMHRLLSTGLDDIWTKRADLRAARIRHYCFDEKDGLFYDYDHVHQRRRPYAFGTMFVPLWVGLATQEQAAAVAKNGLKRLAVAGGLASSDREEYDQWDMPYCWAPLQEFAVTGLRRYGFNAEADNLAINFSSCILKTYLKTGAIWEKYDGVDRSERVRLKIGYAENEVGFGWSCSAFTCFVHSLSPKQRQKVRLLDGIGLHPDDSALEPESSQTSQALDHLAETETLTNDLRSLRLNVL